MKTATDLQAMINDIDKSYNDNKTVVAPALRKKDARLRNFYFKVKLYLETNPREEFLTKQQNKAADYIRITNERGTAQLLERIYPGLSYKQARNQWRKDNQVSHWRAQLKVIQFILN